MARLFNDRRELIERICKNQDLFSQGLLIHRMISVILQEKYKDKDVDVISSSYSKIGDKSEHTVVSKDGTVLDNYQDDRAFNVDIMDLVIDNNTREQRFDLVKPEAFDRIWQLYEEVYPKEIVEDKTFKTIPDILIELIDVDSIDVNPTQIRKSFSDVATLQKSIAKKGLLYPIIVQKNNERYTIFDGEKRWRAVKNLGWPKIRAVIAEQDADLAELGYIGNFHRSNPNPTDTGIAIAKIRVAIKTNNKWGSYENVIPEEEFGKITDRNNPYISLPQINEVVGEVFGISERTQDNLVDILRESEEVQEMIRRGDLDFVEGRVQINIDKKDLPSEFVNAIKKAEQRAKIIERVEEKAKQTGDPNSNFLKYFSSYEKMEKRIGTGMKFYENVDERTKESVKERTKNFIKYLSVVLDIDLKEI